MHLFTDSHAKFGGVPCGDQQGSMAGEQAPCIRPGSSARPDSAEGEARPLPSRPVSPCRYHGAAAAMVGVAWPRASAVRGTVPGVPTGEKQRSAEAAGPARKDAGPEVTAMLAAAGEGI